MIRPERHSPDHAEHAHRRGAGPSRSAGRVSAALLQFPFLIRAATSAQKTKRFLDRARLALRCSISAIFRAFASPYRSRNNPAAARRLS